jgi:glutathione S-transferase
MQWTVLVTALTLGMYLVMGAMVSQARTRYGVKAPAMTGDPAFERICRIHQNTSEQLILFLPSLWMFAVHVSDLWAAGLGLVFIAGRVIYARSYFGDPASRSPGFLLALAATLVLLAGAVIGAFLQG